MLAAPSPALGHADPTHPTNALACVLATLDGRDFYGSADVANAAVGLAEIIERQWFIHQSYDVTLTEDVRLVMQIVLAHARGGTAIRPVDAVQADAAIEHLHALGFSLGRRSGAG